MQGLRGISLACLSLATTATGLVGQILLFHVFGAGQALDLYFYSLAIPSFLAGQLALVFGYYLVPFINQIREDKADIASLVQGFALLLLGGGSLMAVPGALAAGLLAPNRNFPGLWLLTGLAWSSVLIANFSAVFSGILNVQGRFVLAAALPLVSQCGMLVGLFLLKKDLGVLSAAVGLNLGSVVAVVVGWIGCRISSDQAPTKAPFRTTITASCRAAWRFFRQASLLPLILAIFSAHFFIDALVAHRLEAGGLSVLALAHRIAIGAVGLVVSAFAAPMTASLSTTDLQRFNSTLQQYLGRIALFSAAICILLSVNAKPISHLMLEGGKVHIDQLIALERILRILAIAAMPMLLGQFLMRAMLARHAHMQAAKVAAVWATGYCVGAVVLSEALGSLGLAVTYLAAWATCYAAAMTSLRLWPSKAYEYRRLIKLAMIICGMAAVSTTVSWQLSTILHPVPARWAWLLEVATSAVLLAILARIADKALTPPPSATSAVS